MQLGSHRALAGGIAAADAGEIVTEDFYFRRGRYIAFGCNALCGEAAEDGKQSERQTSTVASGGAMHGLLSLLMPPTSRIAGRCV